MSGAWRWLRGGLDKLLAAGATRSGSLVLRRVGTRRYRAVRGTGEGGDILATDLLYDAGRRL